MSDFWGAPSEHSPQSGGVGDLQPLGDGVLLVLGPWAPWRASQEVVLPECHQYLWGYCTPLPSGASVRAVSRGLDWPGGDLG